MVTSRLLPMLLLPLAAALVPPALALTAHALPAAGTPAAAEGSVQEVAQSFADDAVADGVVGIQVALVHDGEVAALAAAGDAGEGRAMTPQTPSRIESLSKSFTSALVMQLVEEDRVELDSPVRTYLPELRLDDPRADDITVRHLLTHASGLADSTTPDAFPTSPDDLAERVALLADASLVAAPGDEFHYHNANYAILARLVEVVSGEPFAERLRTRLTGPLGMTRTVGTQRAGDRVDGMAVGHALAFGRGVEATGPDYFTEGSGGVVSTAEDLARWLQVQTAGGRGPDGTRVLERASVAESHRPQAPQDADYGLGWYRAESAEGPPVRISHSGAGAAYGAYEGIFPDSGWAVAVLVNTGAGLTAVDPSVLGQDLVAAVDPDVPTIGGEPTNGLLADSVLAGLTLLTAGLSVRGVLRSRRWAAARPRVVTGLLRLVPAVLAVGLVLSVPSLQLALTDRTASWPVLWYVEPVAVLWLLTLGAGAAAVLLARIWWWLGDRRGTST